MPASSSLADARLPLTLRPARPRPAQTNPQPSVSGFQGTERFQVLRRLGSGAFGLVYEVYDRRMRARVALKLLTRTDAESLYRFKREFRALADLSHRHVITLHQLFYAEGRWFFTMELVPGTSFVDAVRRLGTPDLDRLRTLCRQLASGLAYLHCHGRLHGDIKPSNVLVTAAGRLVLLDFGLVAESATPTLADGGGQGLGTLAYMAPEHIAGGGLTAAADWWSVGAMLHEALTGGPPVRGSSASQPPLDPTGLGRLCRALLSEDPRARPSGQAVLACLASDTGAPTGTMNDSGILAWAAATAAPADLLAQPFVDRRRELDGLHQALANRHRGRLVTALLVGPWGIGKTMIAERFLAEVRARDPTAIVLQSRGTVRETLPFRTFDPLVDALSHCLRALPREEVAALLPDDVLALARIFPVLRRVEALASARRRVLDIAHPEELRRRAFAALRELLCRLAASRTVILFADDLQWGDSDSAALLAELHRGPEPPAIFELGCCRSEELENWPLLEDIRRQLTPPTGQANLHLLHVAPLAPGAAAELACARGATTNQLAGLLAAADGNPRRLLDLLHLAAAGQSTVRLAPTPQLILDLVAAAPVSPVPVTALRRVLVAHGESASALVPALDALRRQHLLRDAAGEEATAVALTLPPGCQAIRTTRPPSELARLAGELAAVLARPAVADVLPESHQEAERAAEHAIASAAQAEDVLAYDRASRLYRLALSLLPPDHPQVSTVHERLGGALAHAGCATEAAASLLTAAKDGPAERTFDLERRASEQLLLAGELAAGREVLGRLLSRVGLALPGTRLGAVLDDHLRRLRLRLRGLAPARNVALLPLTRRRIDACCSAATALRKLDPERARAMQTRHLELALAGGEPRQIARALALDPAFVVDGGGRTARRAERLLQRASRFAEESADDYARGLVTLTSAMVCCGQGRWLECSELAGRAGEILAEHASGTGWEVSAAQCYGILGLVYTGCWDQLGGRLPALVQAAQGRSNLYNETLLRPWLAGVALLTADQPAAATIDVAATTTQWSERQFHYQHFNVLLARVHVALYCGFHRVAWDAVNEPWPAISGSVVRGVQFIKVCSLDLRIRAAVALAADPTTRPSEARLLLSNVDRDLASIAAEQQGWGDAIAGVARAAAAELRGSRRLAAQELARAEEALDAHGMAVHATVARRRRAELAGGSEGRRQARNADGWLADRRVTNPERLAAVLAPGRWQVAD